MFKSKHSGWTWDLKRTPFGGGGGDFFSSIDPIEAIKTAVNGLADSQMSANDWTSENGWMLPLAVAGGAAGASALGAGAVAGEGAAALGGEVAADGTVFAAGETIPAGTAMADGSVAAIDSSAAATGGAGGGGSFVPTAGNSFVIDPTATYTTASGASGGIAGGGGGGGADIGLGTNAPLQGPTYGELGVTGVPEGGMGPTYAEMGNTGLNTQEAIAAADAASQKAALIDALKTANQVRQVASTANSLSKLLTQGAGSGLSNSLGQLAKGANPQGQALTPLVRGNTNPFAFTQQQPIRNATTPDLALLANLLKQG